MALVIINGQTEPRPYVWSVSELQELARQRVAACPLGEEHLWLAAFEVSSREALLRLRKGHYKGPRPEMERLCRRLWRRYVDMLAVMRVRGCAAS